MNLYQKIHAVMCESESLEKNLTVGTGTNSYKAVGESEVLNAIKPLFKKYGLIILPVSGVIGEVNGTVETEYNGIKKVTARNIAQLTCYYKIIDIETGEFEQVVGFGFGADSQDKGSGKSCTYALKTVLQKTFLLFSGEDTDNDHSDNIGKPKEPKKPEAKVNLIAGYIPLPPSKPAEAKQSPAPVAQTQPQGKPDVPEVKVEEEKPTGYICEECTMPIKAITTDKNRYSAVQVAEMTVERTGRQLCWKCALKLSEVEKAKKAEIAEVAKTK